MNPIKNRLLPYKILAYLLYAEDRPWLEPLGKNKVRLTTGDTARFLRIKISVLWDAIYWLEKYKLVEAVAKEKKRGSVIITLKPLIRDWEE